MKLDIDVKIPESMQREILQQLAETLKTATITVNLNLKNSRY